MISYDKWPLQPEMEMVARGLEKQLRYEQREFLMNMVLAVSGEEDCHRSAAEALGLVHPHVISKGLFASCS